MFTSLEDQASNYRYAVLFCQDDEVVYAKN